MISELPNGRDTRASSAMLREQHGKARGVGVTTM